MFLYLFMTFLYQIVSGLNLLRNYDFQLMENNFRCISVYKNEAKIISMLEKKQQLLIHKKKAIQDLMTPEIESENH